MKIINSSYEILTTDAEIELMLKRCEMAGRTCYCSTDKITQDSYKTFLKTIINSQHTSVLEHGYITVKLICDRGVMAELTRHRICSFSVESTRYCNYSKDKFDGELSFIYPVFCEKEGINDNYSCIALKWGISMQRAEHMYLEMIKDGVKPEEARSILPNSLKTEIVMTANFREWRKIFELRCSPKAHPDMRALMILLLKELQQRVPVIFEDLKYD